MAWFPINQEELKIITNIKSLILTGSLFSAIPFAFSDALPPVGSTVPPRGVIPIKINNVVKNVPLPWIMYCGVPFPRGVIRSVKQLRLVDEGKRVVPCQFRILARWAESDSLRWVGIDFSGDPGKKYFIEYSDKPFHDKDTAKNVIRVEKTGGAFVVNTGPAKYVIPKKGPLIGKLYFDADGNGAFAKNELVLDQAKRDCDVYMIDDKGTVSSIGFDDSDGQTVLEDEGDALHLCVKREGWYVTKDGEKFSKHVTRLHFYAGKPFVKIVHTIIFTRNLADEKNPFLIREFGIKFKDALAKKRVVEFDSSNRFDATFKKVELSSDGDSAYMIQKYYTTFYKRPDKEPVFEIGFQNKTRNIDKILTKGERCGEWVSVSDGAKAYSLVLRNFWQQYPKEFLAEDGSTTIKLWSDRGGKLLDCRIASLLKEWPKDWVGIEYYIKTYITRSFYRSWYSTEGTAKTHEMMLIPHSPTQPPAKTAKIAHLLSEPVLCLPDPAWTLATGTLAPTMPYSPDKYPMEERFIKQWFDKASKGIIHKWYDFGFWDFGAAAHAWYIKPKKGPLKGIWTAYINRYSAADYNYKTNVWRAYVRSGERGYFNDAEEAAQHHMDKKMIHWTGKKRGNYGRGRFKGGLISLVYSPAYWGLYASANLGSSTDLRHLLYYYYLRDARRAGDSFREYCDFIKTRIKYKTAPKGGRPYMTLKCLAEIYEETGDKEILDNGKRLLRFIVDFDKYPEIGLVKGLSLTPFGKFGPKITGIIRWYEATGDELAKKVIVKTAEMKSDYSFGTVTFQYYNSSGEHYYAAYRITGDEKYLYQLRRDLDLALKKLYDPKTKTWNWYPNDAFSICHNVYPLSDLPIALKALTNLKDKRPVPLLRQVVASRPSYAVIRKESGEKVRLMVKSRTPFQPIITDMNGKIAKNAVITPAAAYKYRYPNYKKAPTYEITLPADMKDGDYILNPNSDGLPWELTWITAKKTVLWAPGGLALSTLTPAWWSFNVAKGTKSISVRATGPVVLKRPDGSTLEVTCKVKRKNEWKWIDVPVNGNDAGIWGVKTERGGTYNFVVIKGIKPLFSLDSKGLFVPQFGAFKPPTYYFPGEPASTKTPPPDEKSDKIILLTKKRKIKIDNPGLTSQSGSITFKVKPMWSSVFLPSQRLYAKNVAGHPAWNVFGISIYLGGPQIILDLPYKLNGKQKYFRISAYACLEKDKWTSLVWKWKTEDGKFFFDCYVDGKLSNIGEEYIERKPRLRKIDGKTITLSFPEKFIFNKQIWCSPNCYIKDIQFSKSTNPEGGATSESISR